MNSVMAAEYFVFWEFQVAEAQREAFERAYGPGGVWAAMFQHGDGYLGTDLLLDTNSAGRYVTVDRWQSGKAYELFRAATVAEYERLDAQCEALTVREIFAGAFITTHKA